MTKFRPNWVSPPGHTIRDLVAERFEGDDRLVAEKLGLTLDELSDLYEGQKRITFMIAGRLRDVFGISKKFWRNREKKYTISG